MSQSKQSGKTLKYPQLILVLLSEGRWYVGTTITGTFGTDIHVPSRMYMKTFVILFSSSANINISVFLDTVVKNCTLLYIVQLSGCVC